MRTVLIAAAWLVPGAVAAQGGECGNLSYQRNAIYKAAGYCFKDPAQISRFGNAGCRYDDQADVPLSARDRGQVAAIVQLERDMGCL